MTQYNKYNDKYKCPRYFLNILEKILLNFLKIFSCRYNTYFVNETKY